VPLISASMIACESILTEKNDVISAIRILSILNIPLSVPHATFSTLTSVSSSPGDLYAHVLSVQMVTPSGNLIASAPDHRFFYGYNVDRAGYGGYNLTTNFVSGW